MGIALAFNILIVKHKIELGRMSDAILDGTALVVLSLVFGGSTAGLMIATIASAIISLYLLKYPPTLGESNVA